MSNEGMVLNQRSAWFTVKKDKIGVFDLLVLAQDKHQKWGWAIMEDSELGVITYDDPKENHLCIDYTDEHRDILSPAGITNGEHSSQDEAVQAARRYLEENGVEWHEHL